MKRTFLSAALAVFCAFALCAAEATPLTPIKPCAATQLLLQGDIGAVRDVSGHLPDAAIAVTGAEVVPDDCGMEVIHFTESRGGIVVKDKGAFDFKKGLTVEAWVCLDDDVPAGKWLLVAEKAASWNRNAFGLQLVPGNSFTLSHVSLVCDRIEFTDEEGAHVWPNKTKDNYPGRCNTMNGIVRFPAKKWTHVAFTYDPVYRILRTWVDSGLDREGFNPWWEFADEVVNDGGDLVFFRNSPGVKVAQIHIAGKALEIGKAPPARFFVTENAYREKGYVRVAPVSDAFPVPCEIAIRNNGNEVRHRMTSREPANFPIPAAGVLNEQTDLLIRVLDNGREFCRHETVVFNPSAKDVNVWRRLRGEAEAADGRPEWWLNDDNTFSWKGRPFFPLGLYHVRTNAFDLVCELGFNVLDLVRDTSTNAVPAWNREHEKYFAKAVEKGVTLNPRSCVAGREGQSLMICFDEPWGYSFEPMRQAFMDLRDARTRAAELPLTGAMNNLMRYREMGMVTDIMSIDPYCRGGLPLRYIYDTTRMAVRETDGLKPVFPVIANYGSARYRPDFDELRTASYLAVIGGANGLCYYAWDDSDAPGGPMDTATMPEQVENFRKLFAEFKALDAVLTTPNLKDGPTVADDEPRGVFACARRERGRNGKTHLFVASDLYRTATRTLRFPQMANRTMTLAFGPAREGKRTERLVFDATGAASVTLPPLSTLVFREAATQHP